METPVSIEDASDVGAVRRVAAGVAADALSSEAARGKASLVATELATNLLKYARRGDILVRSYADGSGSGMELLALDKGPGMDSVQAALRDGHSTGGSLGVGLGAVARNSTLLDIHSIAGLGTAVLARIEEAPPPPAQSLAAALACSAITVPKSGQTLCGDAWATRLAGRTAWFTMVDGLGHGPLAAHAAAEAVRVFQESTDLDSPAALIERAHRELKATRGVVMAVAAIDSSAGTLTYASVGNIVGTLAGRGEAQRLRHLATDDGTVGYNLRRARDAAYPWTAESTLILHSDGLLTRWNLSRHAGLLGRHPSLVAGVLFRDFHRGSDDAAVLVVQETV